MLSALLFVNVKLVSRLFKNEYDVRKNVNGKTNFVSFFSVVEEKNDEVEFKCKAKTEDEEVEMEIKDEIKFKVKSKGSDHLEVKVEYEQEIEDATTETETETQYKVKFDRLIEYRKAGATVEISRSGGSSPSDDEGYQWGVDEIVAEVALDSWTDFTPIDVDGNIMTFSTSALDGNATFTFHIAQADDSNTDVTANKMKIDFLLQDYQWNSTDTYVALICGIETEREVKVETEDEDGTKSRQASDVVIDFDDAIDSIGVIPFGEYTWADFAEVGNSTNSTDMEIIEVVATSPEGADSTEIAFSFVGAGMGASKIYWDPEAGVGYRAGDEASGAMALGVSAALMFGSFVVSMLL